MSGVQTLGGTQFWCDRLVVDDHRVQEHVRFGRARVLDAADRRLHTGKSLSEAMDALRSTRPSSTQRGDHLVILLHGYGGKTDRLMPLRDAIRESGMRAEVVQYPSLFRTIDELASSITELIIASAEQHRGVKTVSIVAFSMGGLIASTVMRRLSERNAAPNPGRLLTIGTPHSGSGIASLFKSLTALAGPNVAELALENRQALAHLRGLHVRIGVVGGRSYTNGWRLLGVVGDGDGIVPIESALCVEGAERLIVSGIKHLRLPQDEEVINGAVRFLSGGPLG